MIRLNSVTKSFGDRKIMDSLTAHLPRGCCYCIMGPSGIGKSTLLGLLSGVLKPDSGRVSIENTPSFSFVFNDNRLIPGLTAYGNIRYVTKDEDKITAALKRTGLYDSRDMKPGEMSAGMQRRLALARAIAHGGDCYFIDEPLYGLDVKTGAGILDLIKDEIKGKTAFIVTHSPEEAFFLGDKIVLINEAPVRELIIRSKAEFSSPSEIRDCFFL